MDELYYTFPEVKEILYISEDFGIMISDSLWLAAILLSFLVFRSLLAVVITIFFAGLWIKKRNENPEGFALHLAKNYGIVKRYGLPPGNRICTILYE